MRDIVFILDRKSRKSLQSQIREFLVTAILGGQLMAGEKMPSTRRLSTQLSVSRNTVVLVYQGLNDDGYLKASERSGYFVAETGMEIPATESHEEVVDDDTRVDWRLKVLKYPAAQRNIDKLRNWQSYDYPFVYGQSDPLLFPIADWRDCAFKVLGKKWLDAWSGDTPEEDDEMLVEQIRTRILPRRGILVGEDQILVTMGAQMALYLVASLLVDGSTRLVIEEPGYPDVRNIFSLRTDNILPLSVDHEGLPVSPGVGGADIIYTTPSHQFPTSVTMPIARRKQLLAAAHEHDLLIIEDDYELETNYQGTPVPALKSLDRDERVVYMGSFSKTLFPGLRLGFMVASRELIQEARALRRLMVRHAPFNNQRITAFFLSLGYYDVHLRRLRRAYSERWQTMGDALAAQSVITSNSSGFGGTSYWVEGPKWLNADQLASRALELGVVIEPGGVYFAGEHRPKNFFRLGFSSIPATRITAGIDKLVSLIETMRSEQGY